MARLFAALVLLPLLACVAHAAPEGRWSLLVENAGVSSMHTAVTHFDTVVLLDRTNAGASSINFTDGRCRDNPDERELKHDCSAHSVMLDPATNRLRPLTIFTDTWCSSGQFVGNGSLIQTGGGNEGLNRIRRLDACSAYAACDWVESGADSLVDGRWYGTNQLLPDGTRQIVVGGRRSPTYEFVPKRRSGEGSFALSLLSEAEDGQGDNMYPFVHLLPDGNLFVFANRDSVLLDYEHDVVRRKYPRIPGEPRNYPSAGSSVLLPLDHRNGFETAEVLVCGGSRRGAFRSSDGWQWPASATCGRIDATGSDPAWTMETMPVRRTMGDMIVLPTGDVLLVNGATKGCQGWGKASDPALHPVLYAAREDTPRFRVLAPSTIPRLYHSTANLLSDGRILIAGSNTHRHYTFSGQFPTELRVEAFHPPYLDSAYDEVRPRIVQATRTIAHGAEWGVVFRVGRRAGEVEARLASAAFGTHSYAQGQRVLRLATADPVPTAFGGLFSATVAAPARLAALPRSWYMLFVVQADVPSPAVWVRIA